MIAASVWMAPPISKPVSDRIERFGYRSFAKRSLTGKLNVPRLRAIVQNGRPAVFYSREDLTAGMVGEPVDGVMGYTPETATEILERLGGIPASRLITVPPPGQATEDDVLRWIEAPRKRICELIDGILVEKTMGAPEGYLAGEIIQRMGYHVREHQLGVLYTPDSPFRVLPGHFLDCVELLRP